jgi:hypothetical protein
MSVLKNLEQNGFKMWEEVATLGGEYIYCWANSRAALGVGRTSYSSANKRVNPILSKKSVASDKDAGKKFLAAFIAKETNEKMYLYAKLDSSKKTSKNTSELEVLTKKTLIQNGFVILDGIAYSKINFNKTRVLSKVQTVFGVNSIEDMIASLCASDGDLWSRMYAHTLTKQALSRIIDELLLTNED